jgi:hypothetical protein
MSEPALLQHFVARHAAHRVGADGVVNALCRYKMARVRAFHRLESVR